MGLFSLPKTSASKKRLVHLVNIDSCLFCERSLTRALGVIHIPSWCCATLLQKDKGKTTWRNQGMINIYTQKCVPDSYFMQNMRKDTQSPALSEQGVIRYNFVMSSKQITVLYGMIISTSFRS